MDIKYKLVCEEFPNLSRTIRNALMSKVTNSKHSKFDTKEVLFALRKFKKKKRLKLIESFIKIKSETTDFTEIMPNVIKFFDIVNKLKK